MDVTSPAIQRPVVRSSPPAFSSGLLLVLPALLLLGVFFALPLLLAASLSVRTFDARVFVGGEFTLANFARFLFDPFYLSAFARTVLVAGLTTVACVLVGYPVAYHLRSVASQTVRALLTLVIVLPLMLSLVVSSFAWLIILGSSGLLNSALEWTGLLSEPLRLLNSEVGVIVVLVYSFLPYMVLNVYAALENIDPSLLRAARVLGASDARAFREVTLPLSTPGILSGSLIVFSLSMAAFVIPHLIGGGRVKVVPLLIYNFTVQLFDWPGAATLGVLLFLVTTALAFLLSRMVERRLTRWLHP